MRDVDTVDLPSFVDMAIDKLGPDDYLVLSSPDISTSQANALHELLPPDLSPRVIIVNSGSVCIHDCDEVADAIDAMRKDISS